MPQLASSDNDLGLSIRLLGGCRISVSGQAIEPSAWRLRKAQALIKLLALAPDHRLHQEQLQEFLWPDLEPGSAANNLYKALHVARRMLAPNSSAPSGYLQRQGELIALAPSAVVWIDVEAFEAALAAARRTSDPAAYWTAIGLYGGDLLPEDRYEEWAVDRREWLRRMYAASLIEVARLHEDRREYERAIEALQRIVEGEQADEEAHTGLMRIYALAGQRHQALRQYEQLKAALQRELDVEPAEESTRLYREILAGRSPDRAAPSDHGQPEATVDGDLSPVRARDNLPCLLTRFIGREREKIEVERRLHAGRLVTLTGTGGCGKSRLALEVAAELREAYPDGVWLVELSGLADPALVPQSIASVVGVWGEPDRPLLETLASYLRQRRLLLLLDNCEHVVECCAAVADELLHACPELRILATSRQALSIAGESDWRVPSLAVPDPGALPSLELLAQYEAVQLFLDRARSSRSDFTLTSQNATSVAQICLRLDGMPLAIELAAARVKALSVEDIAARLDDRFQLLSRGSRTAPRRHQTLRAAVDWSYDLLSPDEQVLFARLSVFAGGWSLPAAEAVCGDDGAAGSSSLVPRSAVLDLLSQLVDKSLVAAEASAQETVRYRLLETLRQYGQERLAASGQDASVRQRHAEWCLAFAERAGPQAKGPDAAVWLEALEWDHANLRSALTWLVDQGDGLRLIRLAGALSTFWRAHAHFAEGLHWCETALDLGREAPAADRLRAMNGAGIMAWYLADIQQSVHWDEQALALAREIGDRKTEASTLNSLASNFVDLEPGAYDQASALYEASLALARSIDEPELMVSPLYNLGIVARQRGDPAAATQRFAEALALAREHGVPRFVPMILRGFGTVTLDLGDVTQAVALFQESLELACARGNLPDAVDTLEGLGRVSAVTGQTRQAARLFGAAAALRDEIAMPHTPEDAALVAPVLTALQEALGAEAYATAWADGRALSQQEAIEEALAVRAEPGESATDTAERRADTHGLTARELEVLRLLAVGRSNQEIGEMLFIRRTTVARHVANIYSKLGFETRAQAMAFAHEHGFV